MEGGIHPYNRKTCPPLPWEWEKDFLHGFCAETWEMRDDKQVKGWRVARREKGAIQKEETKFSEVRKEVASSHKKEDQCSWSSEDQDERCALLPQSKAGASSFPSTTGAPRLLSLAFPTVPRTQLGTDSKVLMHSESTGVGHLTQSVLGEVCLRWRHFLGWRFGLLTSLIKMGLLRGTAL